MDVFCPNCKVKTIELMECEICGNLGCTKCIRKKGGKWLCQNCFNKNSDKTSSEENIGDIFSSMFG